MRDSWENSAIMLILLRVCAIEQILIAWTVAIQWHSIRILDAPYLLPKTLA
ncbi:MAG: hypothetical protein HC849_00850 [Oscillatoriales cyanobacterium RU_3_3]|nr:hypothetical protein [Oscillatoriales cyanobacterium RU_3_3]